MSALSIAPSIEQAAEPLGLSALHPSVPFPQVMEAGPMPGLVQGILVQESPQHHGSRHHDCFRGGFHRSMNCQTLQYR